MIILIFIPLLVLAAFYGSKFIRKNNKILYIVFVLVSLVSILSFVLEKKIPIFKPFNQGFLGLSFFYIVMLAGSLKDKSKLRISLLKVRAEYSILGFICITPHALNFFIKFLNNKISLPIYGLIVYIIMIPLFITSFKFIRKRMSKKSWKNLQRAAYISYIGLFVHLILMSDGKNLVVYLVLFIIYFLLKGFYTYKLNLQKKKKKELLKSK